MPNRFGNCRCCNNEPCSPNCTGDLPIKWLTKVAGATSGPCGDCSDINGREFEPQAQVGSCKWKSAAVGTFCGANPYTEIEFVKDGADYLARHYLHVGSDQVVHDAVVSSGSAPVCCQLGKKTLAYNASLTTHTGCDWSASTAEVTSQCSLCPWCVDGTPMSATLTVTAPSELVLSSNCFCRDFVGVHPVAWTAPVTADACAWFSSIGFPTGYCNEQYVYLELFQSGGVYLLQARLTIFDPFLQEETAVYSANLGSTKPDCGTIVGQSLTYDHSINPETLCTNLDQLTVTADL